MLQLINLLPGQNRWAKGSRRLDLWAMTGWSPEIEVKGSVEYNKDPKMSRTSDRRPASVWNLRLFMQWDAVA